MYRKELPKKGQGLGQFADLRGAWRIRGSSFEGGGGFDSPVHTVLYILCKLIECYKCLAYNIYF